MDVAHKDPWLIAAILGKSQEKMAKSLALMESALIMHVQQLPLTHNEELMQNQRSLQAADDALETA